MVLAHNPYDGTRTQDIEISVDVTFDSMLLSNNTLGGLKSSGFYKPSPIQLHGIPLGKCGFDLFLEAKSGTGKTAVFTVIALEKLDLDKALQAVILTPTREIAAQITDVIKQIGSKYVGLNVEVVMGGLPIEEDIEKFQKKVHILVGSPGRMRHLIQNKHIDVSAVRLLVLDEADKLMDRSFKADINYIFSILPKQKQVIMSSATYPDTLKAIMQNYVQKAQHICPDSTSILLGLKQLVTTVKSNMNIVTQTQNKFEELMKILSNREFKQCLIFCNYQVRVGELCKMLVRKKWPADKLHGQLAQTERLDALKTLQEYKCRILVSTDLAARGIDASNVDLVINFEPPSEWQTYLHRIGRAGRFGSYGVAITIVSEGKELNKFKEMIKSISHSLKVNYLWNDNELNDSNVNYESNEKSIKEIDESSQAENEKCKESEVKDISNTPQMEERSKTPAVKDIKILEVDEINKSEFKKNCETPELELRRKTSKVKVLDRTSGEGDSMCKMLEIENCKVLLDLQKEQVNDSCFELIEISNHQIFENNNVDQSFGKIFNSNETPEKFKLESFNDLMASFKVHEPNSDEAIAIRDVTFRTYFDSMSNAETQPNILLELHSSTDCEAVVCYSTECASSSNTITNSPTSNNHGEKEFCKKSEARKSGSSLNKINDDLKHLTLDKGDYLATCQASDNALINAGLPTSFGSKKYSKRVNEPKLMQNSEPVTNKLKSNNIANSKFKTTNEHNQTSSKVLKETFLNSSKASPTSFGDDGYNTRSCLYSRSTKCMQPRSKQNRHSRNDNESIYSEMSNSSMEMSSDFNSKYNNWYKQFKTHMNLVEMSLYIDELSKM